ncbi:hypothetical protein [Bacillus sp. CGMCC 1.60114]
MKKKILSYIAASVLVAIGVYLFIDYSNKTQETKDTSTPPCHIKK